MRRIVAGEFISLDGVVESANQLTGQYFSEDLGAYLEAGMASTDTLLLGRVTYQEMVPFWADKTGSEDPVAKHMSKPKYVVSTTLDNADDWPSSTLIRGDVAGQLSSLKEQPGKDVLVVGSAALVRWLLREGLLDQLDLLLFPIVVGGGMRLFEDGGDQIPLRLTCSQALSTGVVHLRYEKA